MVLAATSADEQLGPLPRRIHLAHGPHVGLKHKIALTGDDGAVSYGDLGSAIQETADDLRSLGIRAGDRIMIVSENCIALALLLLASSAIDAWPIIVNPRLSARELDLIRDHSGARRVFLTAGISKEAAAHAERYEGKALSFRRIRDVAGGPLDEAATQEPIFESAETQVGVLIYTSGTTGTPKGVMLSHRNLLFSARAAAELRKLTELDQVYLVLPASHIVGISVLIMSLLTGATVRLVSKYDPAALARSIGAGEVTILNGVPATYQRLLEYQTLSGVALNRGSLRLITVAGAPLDQDLKERTERAVGLPLLNGYGITECSPGISAVRFEAPRTDSSVGSVLPGVDVRLVDSKGVPVRDGETGELHVRGPNVMMGYYKSPDLTAKAIDGSGWFNTGDLAVMREGALFIVGRTKEMIIRSGFNVYPAEVEAVLASHEAVVQCAVVGRKADANEEIVAFVQLIAGSSVTATELMEYVRPQLTSYKRPSEIVVLKSLPATSTGKIQKHLLSESLRKP
ncbi:MULTISPECIES: class I adenylate-forming enzyme family protein [unclassified Bradyrhizobium]|uniref:class I adenylate-forming enzyme family protein n=1 Tax=unclassified Bradyrhizobium TaxID=2631580 RepID=UPI0023054D6E|nr:MULTISPECIES: AMP-binding protein [unclassified Bradyrhizobium]MDA9451204.1 long-chain fatty acid--CoA ligase [Bradyrhizobium sp. CCBAU 21360]MDA9457583.1 long-chain fatty acid--CoA ligase [Bradyrhizobium sp. CCBAU 21359]